MAHNEIIEISLGELLPRVSGYKAENWRLSQLCANICEAGYQLSYSFAKGLDYETLRLETALVQEIPSITQIYTCAFIQESEMKELFGVPVTMLQPDMGKTLYRIDTETPFLRKE